ncbi:hypothetical protein [Reichenbachiella sp.]|uniref:hypothetical protein n=1 Tax=Reichenbachiella sp. TaxID=2184521 RepID=UPI003BB0584A
MRNLNSWFLKYWGFLAFSILVFALPALLTQFKVTIFDFTWSGQIGDTIGGITAPFVGLFGAYLVYKAFLAQIKANEIQTKAIQNQLRDKEIDIAFKLLDDVNEIMNRKERSYTRPLFHIPSRQDVKGQNYYDLFNDWQFLAVFPGDSEAEQITRVMGQIGALSVFVIESSTLSERDKKLILEKAIMSVVSPIMDALIRIWYYEEKRAAEPPSKQYEVAKDWLEYFNPIVESIYTYLGYENKKIVYPNKEA